MGKCEYLKIGNYSISIDLGKKGGDFTAYTLSRRPFWWERLLRKPNISKAIWEFKIIKIWTKEN